MKNIKFLFALFVMLLLAAFSGAVLGGMLVIEIVNKRKVDSIEDILEENFEDEKKKNSSLEGTTKGFSEQSPTTSSIMDVLYKLLAVGTAIRNSAIPLDSKHIQIMKVRYTPCNKRFRISHEGMFWIPPEYESDYDCPPKNSEDQHYYIRNLFIEASGRES